VKKLSKSFEAVHETATGLHSAGVIDQMTAREFDQACASRAPPLRPAGIKRMRKKRTSVRPSS
jgi:putative transcriptional regulator